MKPRERFIAELERRGVPGRVPHFELGFYLTMESLGRVFPLHRHYDQWKQMSENERKLQREDMADIYINVAGKYEQSAILYHPNPDSDEEAMRLADIIRDRTEDRYFLMLHGDATFSIPNGDRMAEEAERYFEEPENVKDEAKRMVECALDRGKRLRAHGGIDGFALCADYCFNTGPFLSPAMFGEFVAPYLKELVGGYRELGFYTIKHTDGNIMPILDFLLDAHPHALHSLDPQAGVDMAQMVRLAGDKVCLIGNVNCALLDTGTDEQVIASARYSLEHGKKAPGYVFSTSNCIYTGMDLKRYDLILDVWRREGDRAEAGAKAIEMR